jgi:hypothetical protein
MNQKEFDEKFQGLCNKLVDIAFDYVACNRDEVDTIYVFASFEGGNSIYYALFYKINGQMVQRHKVNTVSNQQYDVSREPTKSMLGRGRDCQEEIMFVFEEYKQKLPELIKIIYHPKSGEFKKELSYELQYTKKGKFATDVCDEWFVEMGGKL